MFTCFFVAGYLISSINSFASASIKSANKDNHNLNSYFSNAFRRASKTVQQLRRLWVYDKDEDTVAKAAKISLRKMKQNNRNPKLLKDHSS